MHPVLIYALVFVASALSLLPLFEAYAVESIQLYILALVLATFVIGRSLARLMPFKDPMLNDQAGEHAIRKARDYKREIQYLFNIVQPDPKMQPPVKRIQGGLQEYFILPEDEIVRRLRQHFGEEFVLTPDQSIVELIEELKKRYPGWPDQQ